MSACHKVRPQFDQEAEQGHPQTEESGSKKENVVPQRKRAIVRALISPIELSEKSEHGESLARPG